MAAAQARPESTRTDVVRTVANTDVPGLIIKSKTAASYIEPLLPRGVTLAEVAAQTRLALAKDTTGALANCTAGSVILSVAKIVGWGLVVGETAHLVPFGDECTAIRDYKGDIEMAIRSGVVRHIDAQCVYANEQFKILRGYPTGYQHEVITDGKARGAMVGAYCFAVLRGNHTLIEYRSVEEVDEIRQAKSKQWKKGAVPPWYMKKTVIKQLLKPLPKNDAMQKAFAEMDAAADQRAASLDAALADMPLLSAGESGAARYTLAEEREARRPKALVEGGYDDTPVPPAQHSDDPGARDEDYIDDSDLVD